MLAIAAATALLLLTTVPAAVRPVTGLPHGLEHLGAFLLGGALFAAAFAIRTWVAVLGVVGFAAVLELLQIPLSTRHARLEDFLVDAAAMAAGVMLARLGRSYLSRGA